MQSNYYYFYFPFSLCFDELYEGQYYRKTNDKTDEDKKEQIIKLIIRENFYQSDFNKKNCFYVFFNESLIFVHNKNNVWFFNFLILKENIAILYDSLNPIIHPKCLTKEELNLIVEQTDHCHDYDYLRDLNLYTLIIQQAIDEAFYFPKPRNKKEAQRDVESINKSIIKTKCDYRSNHEKIAYDARLFLLNKTDWLDYYLSALDIDIDVFIEKMKAKIDEYDVITPRLSNKEIAKLCLKTKFNKSCKKKGNPDLRKRDET